MNGDKKSLEEHSNNIFASLTNNSSQNIQNKESSNANDQAKNKEASASTESIKNANKNINPETSNSEKNENVELKSIDSSMMERPLSELVTSIENSIAEIKSNNQKKEEAKEIEREKTIEEPNQNSEKNQDQINNNIPDQVLKSSEDYQSTDTTRSYSSSKTSSSNRNDKKKKDNQPPKLQGRLPQIIFHSPDSLTYKALTLQPLPPMNRQTRSSVILDLSSYIDQCTQEGMIAEANFILEVSENVKKIQTPRKIEILQMQLKDNLDNCNNEIEAQNLYWEEQETVANNDYKSLVEELDDRLNTELESLDREWQDPKKYSAYSKPSPALLNYRYVANKLIASKDFSSIPQLSKIISKLHEEEATEASRRMEYDYKLAESNIISKYKKERETIEKIHESKLDNLARMKERSLIPIQSRKKLMETKSNKLKALQSNRIQLSSSMNSKPVIQNFDSTIMNDLITQPKLKLPPMKIKNRAATSLSSKTKQINRKSDSAIMNKKSKSALNSTFIDPKSNTNITT